MYFQEYWQARRRESFVESRVIAETVGFVLFLALGFIRFKYPNFPIDQTIWWAMACVFFAALLIDICFISPYRHAESLELEHKEEVLKLKERLSESQKKIEDLLVQRNEPQAVFSALDELDNLIGQGENLNARFQLIDIPNAPAPPDWHEVGQWEERTDELVNRDVFKDYLDSSDRTEFKEGWSSDQLRAAISNMQHFGYLPSTEQEGIYRHLWGRLQRLKEVVALVKSGPKNSPSRIRFEKRKSEREECLRQAATLLKKGTSQQVLWSMNALFIAAAHALQKNEDVVWVCRELEQNNHAHPFDGIMNHVPQHDWLKFLRRALVYEGIKTEHSGDYLTLADQWPHLNGYPEPADPIPQRLWILKEVLACQEQ
jgi:hypothetical protein